MFISKKPEIEKNEKTRFKKFQVKICHFTAKTTLKGRKKGSQGDTLQKHKKRGFQRPQKPTFFEKHIRIKGITKKTPFKKIKKLKKSSKKPVFVRGKNYDHFLLTKCEKSPFSEKHIDYKGKSKKPMQTPKSDPLFLENT